MSQSKKRNSRPVIKNVDQAARLYFAISSSWRRGTCEFTVGDALNILREAQMVTVATKPALTHSIQQLAMEIVFGNQDDAVVA